MKAFLIVLLKHWVCDVLIMEVFVLRYHRSLMSAIYTFPSLSFALKITTIASSSSSSSYFVHICTDLIVCFVSSFLFQSETVILRICCSNSSRIDYILYKAGFLYYHLSIINQVLTKFFSNNFFFATFINQLMFF